MLDILFRREEKRKVTLCNKRGLCVLDILFRMEEKRKVTLC